ncbi:MAG TPA: flagellar FlbD family protein [Bacillota bacterium]|nr:flagellar FlbD family protein [Bacillota bacterium]
MIRVTRLNGMEFYVNPLLIEAIEETPDTIIALTTGKKYIIKESATETTELIKSFLREVDLLKALRLIESKKRNGQE